MAITAVNAEEPEDLDQIWQQVLGGIDSRVYSSILKSHARLIAIENDVAGLHIAPVWRSFFYRYETQTNRVFAKVLKRKVTISLVG